MDIGNLTTIGEVHGVSLLHFLFFLHSCSGKYDLLMQCKDGAQEERFVGGSNSLSVKLAERMNEGTLFLSMPVLQICQHKLQDEGEQGKEGKEKQEDKEQQEEASDEYVEVICKDGTRFTSSYVIVAVPPNQASRIHFSPPLPATKSHLLHGTQMAAAIKVHSLANQVPAYIPRRLPCIRVLGGETKA